MKLNLGITAARASHGRKSTTLVWVLALPSLLALMMPACGSTKASPPPTTCSLTSDCTKPYVCSLGSCRTQCHTSADCGATGACVGDGIYAVCIDRNAPCNTQKDCTAPLACATDYRCRNLCSTDDDCNVLGIYGRVCATDQNNVEFCAEPSDTGADGGAVTLTADPPPTHGTDPVPAPALEAGGSGGVGGANSSTAGAGQNASGMSAAGLGGQGGTTGQSMGGTTSAGAGGSSSGGASGSGGSTVECSPACGVGKQCVDGSCAPCGKVAGEPCCDTICSGNLTCSQGKCACGDPGQACCGGTVCSGGVPCTSGTCTCGGAGQVCCPTDAGNACEGSLACTGARCTCIVAAHEDMVQRSDGSLWWYDTTGNVPFVGVGTMAPTAIKNGDASLFIASKFARLVDAFCGVQSDGSLWCGDLTGATNTAGELGNGTTNGSTTPSHVVTSVAGPALTGVKNVFADPAGNTACAINASGALWCWGDGQHGILGNGYSNDSQFAIPVLTASGGSQFTGVASVSISSDHVCAVTTLGALYCWGDNSFGQLGLGTPIKQYLYPTRVTSLFNSVANVSVARDLYYNGSSTCAATTDGDAWCWGSNDYGQLGNGQTGGTETLPVQVLAAPDGGAPFLGVSSVQLLFQGIGVMAVKVSDGSLWAWGQITGSAVPEPYGDGGFPSTGVFQLTEDTADFFNGGSGLVLFPEFLDSDGSFHRNRTVVPSPPCP